MSIGRGGVLLAGLSGPPDTFENEKTVSVLVLVIRLVVCPRHFSPIGRGEFWENDIADDFRMHLRDVETLHQW